MLPSTLPVVTVPVVTLSEVLPGGMVWWVVGLGVVAVGAASALRIVPEHERVVVSRLGRVVGVRGPGLVGVIPGVEQLTAVSLRPVQLSVNVSATTREGVLVHLVALATVRVADPVLATIAVPDPHSAAVDALERRLVREVARSELAVLWSECEQLEEHVEREVAAAAATWGAEVTEVEVTDVEAQLTAELLRTTHRQAEAGDQ
jgi:regulator of protease activity HflC (stomatin/prohibitin superfamily)